MSGEKCTGTDCPGCAHARRHYKAHGCLLPNCTDPHHTATPEPSEVAETTAGEPEGCHVGYPYCDGRRPCACPCHDPAEPDAGEVEALAKVEGLLGEWQRGEIPVDVVLAHLTALLDRERREVGERIAGAIEEITPAAPHTITPRTAGAQGRRSALVEAARIARDEAAR